MKELLEFFYFRYFQVERLETEAKSLQLEAKTARTERDEFSDKYRRLCQEHEAEVLQRCKQSPASKRLMVDLLKSEKEELERQVTELQHLNVSAKELKVRIFVAMSFCCCCCFY
jgi:hypothetical protein